MPLAPNPEFPAPTRPRLPLILPEAAMPPAGQLQEDAIAQAVRQVFTPAMVRDQLLAFLSRGLARGPGH